MDAKGTRNMFEGSDHYALLAEMIIGGTWVYDMSGSWRKVRVLASRKLERKSFRD